MLGCYEDAWFVMTVVVSACGPGNAFISLRLYLGVSSVIGVFAFVGCNQAKVVLVCTPSKDVQDCHSINNWPWFHFSRFSGCVSVTVTLWFILHLTDM